MLEQQALNVDFTKKQFFSDKALGAQIVEKLFHPENNTILYTVWA